MKVTRENRTLKITGLPKTIRGESNPLSEIDIYVNYVDRQDSMNRLWKALVVDGLLLPLIQKALEEAGE